MQAKTVANTNGRTLPELLMLGSETENRAESWQAGRFSKGNPQHCTAVIHIPVVLRMEISPDGWNDGQVEALQLMKGESKTRRHDMGARGG